MREAEAAATRKVITHRQHVHVVRRDPGQHPVLDGIARCVNQRVGDLDVAVHLSEVWVIHVDANDILVNPQKVDDWVTVSHVHVRDAGDLQNGDREKNSHNAWDGADW